MNSLQILLKSLAQFLSAEKVKYVILGGIAVSIYGEPRLTDDVDVNILFEKAKISAFLKNARKFGLLPTFPNVEELAQKSGVIPMYFKKRSALGKVDLIIAQNILEHNAIKRGRLKKIEGIKVKVVSPEDLVLHKMASSRAIDREDLRGILIRQSGRLDQRYIGYWLRKLDEENKGCRLHHEYRKLRNELMV